MIVVLEGGIVNIYIINALVVLQWVLLRNVLLLRIFWPMFVTEVT